MIFYYSGSLGGIYQLEEMLDFFSIINRNFPKAYFLFFTPNINILKKELDKSKYINIKKHIIKNLIYPNAWFSIFYYMVREINKILKFK